MSELITWVADLISITNFIWIRVFDSIVSVDSSFFIAVISCFIAAVSCLIALVSAIIAKSNVNLTHDLVEETRKMREIQTEPIIYAYIEPKDELNDITDMFIKNIGLGLACDIKFNVSEFRYAKNKLLSDVTPIKNGIKYLAPNQKIQIFSVQTFKIYEFNSKDLDQIDINIRYKYGINNEKEEHIQLNISTIRNIQRLGVRSSRTVFATEKISREIAKISSNIEELKEYLLNNKNEIEEQKQS